MNIFLYGFKFSKTTYSFSFYIYLIKTILIVFTIIKKFLCIDLFEFFFIFRVLQDHIFSYFNLWNIFIYILYISLYISYQKNINYISKFTIKKIFVYRLVWIFFFVLLYILWSQSLKQFLSLSLYIYIYFIKRILIVFIIKKFLYIDLFEFFFSI